MKIDVAGVIVDSLTKSEVLTKIDRLMSERKEAYFVTPYSEMIVFAINDPDYRKVLNGAEIALPDGIGVLWAAKYLSLPSANFLSALWQIVYTGAAIVFRPDYVRTQIKERITGSRLIYDIARLAAERNYTISLVGGQGNVAAQSAYELKKLFPRLSIKLAVSGRPFDEKTISEINESNSDILFIAYSPPKQEKWLADNIQKLNVRLAMGLGGTFDYLAGIRPTAPKFVQAVGLEWLWRLLTQPYRWKRMWNAVPVFIWKIYKFKIKRIYGTRN